MLIYPAAAFTWMIAKILKWPMKNLIGACSLLICQSVFSMAAGQTFTTPGSLELGGDFSFAYQKSKSDKELSFNIFSFNGFAGIMALSGFEIGISPSVTGYSGSGLSATSFSLYASPSYVLKPKPMCIQSFLWWPVSGWGTMAIIRQQLQAWEVMRVSK